MENSLKISPFEALEPLFYTRKQPSKKSSLLYLYPPSENDFYKEVAKSYRDQVIKLKREKNRTRLTVKEEIRLL